MLNLVGVRILSPDGRCILSLLPRVPTMSLKTQTYINTHPISSIWQLYTVWSLKKSTFSQVCSQVLTGVNASEVTSHYQCAKTLLFLNLAMPSIFKMCLFTKQIKWEVQNKMMGRGKPSISIIFSAAFGRDIKNIQPCEMSWDSILTHYTAHCHRERTFSLFTTHWGSKLNQFFWVVPLYFLL